MTTADAQSTADDQQLGRMERIRKLLDKAEKAGTPEEAEIYTGKAYDLMEKHAIDEAVMAKFRGDASKSEEVGTLRISRTGIFAKNWQDMDCRVAMALGGKAVLDNYGKQTSTIMHNFNSDLERTNVTVTSLQLQCQSAMKVWIREQGAAWKDRPNWTKFTDKRQFIDEFGRAAAQKIANARTVAVREAATVRAEQSNGAETVETATTGVELALRERKDAVQDWYDKFYGDSLRAARPRRQSSGSYGAAAAGRAAGRNADTGSTRVGGGRRQIGR